jgi:FlaG/FlaF family flagellin (archaellin)
MGMVRNWRKLYVGIAILCVAMLSTTLAANMTINAGKSVQFGQGLYQIKACEQWVNVTLNDISLSDTQTVSGSAGSGGNYVSAVYIQGLDALHCKNTTFTVQFYDSSGSSTPMNMFMGGFAPVNQIELGIGQAVDQFSQTYLIDENGSNIGRTDGNQTLTYNQTTGTYIVTFAKPMALASSLTSPYVKSVTIQSSGMRN